MQLSTSQRLADRTNTATLSVHTNKVRALALSTDNKWLYSGSDDTSIKIWRLADNTNTATLSGHTDYVYALALSADNKWLYTGSGDDNSIKIWRLPETVRCGSSWFSSIHHFLVLFFTASRLYTSAADSSRGCQAADTRGSAPGPNRGAGQGPA